MGKRKTVKFTKTSVSAILDAGQRGEWVDSEASALCLRIQKDGGRPSWSTRITLKNGERPTKTTRRIGCPMTLDYKEARQRALEAQKLAGRGIDPKTWLLEQELGGPLARPSDDDDPWLFETVRNAYFRHLDARYGPSTRRNYKQCLLYPEVREALEGKPVTEITRKDVEAARDTIIAKGKAPQAASCVRTLKTFFRWIEEETDAPMENSSVRRARPEPRRGGNIEINPKRKASEQVPPLEALRSAADKIRNASLTANQKLAGLLTLYTAQRPLSVASARPEDFEPVEGLDGWLLWTVGHTKRQTERGLEGHTVLLPPILSDIIKIAAETTASASWLFPKERVRRKGDNPDGYSHESMVSKGFREAGVGFTPKQVRKGFATHLGRQGFPLSHIQMILHHAEGLTDVTSMHYAFHDHQHPKRAAMSAWLELLNPPQAD